MKKLILALFLVVNIYAEDTFLGTLPDGLEFGKPIPEDIIGLFRRDGNWRIWDGMYSLEVSKNTNNILRFHFYAEDGWPEHWKKQGLIVRGNITLNKIIKIVRKHKNVKRLSMDVWKNNDASGYIHFSIENHNYTIHGEDGLRYINISIEH